MDERTAFENYMTDGGTWPKSVVRGRDGQYLLAQTAAAWTVWQARAAQPEPAAPTEYEVAPNGRRSAVLTAMMNARTRAEAALAEPQEPDVPEVCFGNIPPVGWLESPHGEFRKNLLYKLEFPSQLLSWQIPLYAHLRAALAQPEPAAPTVVEPSESLEALRVMLQEAVNRLIATTPRAALTDEQIRDLWSWSATCEAERTATTQQHAFARAVEAAHGIGGPK